MVLIAIEILLSIILTFLSIAKTFYLAFLLRWAPYITGFLMSYLFYVRIPWANNLIAGNPTFSFFAVLCSVEVVILVLMLIKAVKDSVCMATSLIGDSFLISIPAALLFQKQMNSFSSCLFLTAITITGTVLAAVINQKMRQSDYAAESKKKAISHLLCALLYSFGISISAIFIYAAIWSKYIMSISGSDLSNVVMIIAAIFGVAVYIFQNLINTLILREDNI